MNNLLSANFARLKKSKAFWISVVALGVYALLNMIVPFINIDIFKVQGKDFDDVYFRHSPTVGFFIAIFTTFFIGTEYSDGTLRNKIIMGKTRTTIYLSNLITTFFTFVMLLSIWVTVSLIGIPFLGTFKIGIPNAIIYIIIMIFLIASFSAIFTFIAMLCSNWTFTLLCSILIFFGLIALSANIDNVLNAPKMITNMYDLTVNGVVEKLVPYPNPKYVEEPLRTIYEYISDFLPTGQSFKVTWLEVVNPIRMIVFSIINTVAITTLGVLLFNKKDLK